MKVVPNAVTLLGLVLGAAGGLSMVSGAPATGAVLWWLGVLCDNVDGPIARRLGASSEQGAMLDALGDLVLYGLGPVCLLLSVSGYGLLMGLPVLASSAWRLASDLVADAKGVHFGVPAVVLFAAYPYVDVGTVAGAVWSGLAMLWLTSVPALPLLWLRLVLSVLGLVGLVGALSL